MGLGFSSWSIDYRENLGHVGSDDCNRKEIIAVIIITYVVSKKIIKIPYICYSFSIYIYDQKI